ncbi:hypothetical protein MUK42_32692 [Musa troglodytarum]|uniref:Uncharacterized protein n=1 Tax=Musa troglodytarum TaxID=320322 RepID=A0A9E7FC79_9LILI|nr:hypothetical protein MUK42_32692 [Musa troglodytarum]
MAHVKAATLTFTSSLLAPRSGTLPPLFEDDFGFEIPPAGGPAHYRLVPREDHQSLHDTDWRGLTCRKHPLPVSTTCMMPGELRLACGDGVSAMEMRMLGSPLIHIHTLEKLIQSLVADPSGCVSCSRPKMTKMGEAGSSGLGLRLTCSPSSLPAA